MCGITGFWNSFKSTRANPQILRHMTNAIRHRGPDDDGAWFDQQAGLALGHRRLSIVDLSPAGHQPMTSHSGRYVIAYNGEIYNHRALRSELDRLNPSIIWRGHSDTEVVLAAFEKWGITPTLERLNGMFAFALWDNERKILTLARDRMGEKPLYYGYSGKTFLFGSELKSLTVHPNFSAQIDKRALTLFFRHNYIPCPLSIWQGINKLPPASFVEVSEGGKRISSPQVYWSFSNAVSRGLSDPLQADNGLTDHVEALLKDAVRLRMEADVPLGAFVSGGIDSSIIVALMQAQSARPVRTFTIGSDDPRFNEAEHAHAIAKHLGTDHTAMYVSSKDAIETITKMPLIWDEPFADSSQIPTFLVSKLASTHVTVSLTGDGGDELFGGYNRYVNGVKIWNLASRLPSPLRLALTYGLKDPRVARASDALMNYVPSRHKVMNFGGRLHKVGVLMEQSNPEQVYYKMVAQCDEPASLLLNGMDCPIVNSEVPVFDDFRHEMMFRDTQTYLPDDILVKLDRAAMAVGLEGRTPFLDHRVVELAWRLPLSVKIQGNVGKKILRDILYRHVPKELIDRPKMGFAVPVGAWLRGPLRGWVENLLEPSRLENEGILNVAKVREIWLKHLNGDERHTTILWALLMFQAWLEHQGGAQAGIVPYSTVKFTLGGTYG